jgi:hypothetical protein
MQTLFVPVVRGEIRRSVRITIPDDADVWDIVQAVADLTRIPVFDLSCFGARKGDTEKEAMDSATKVDGWDLGSIEVITNPEEPPSAKVASAANPREFSKRPTSVGIPQNSLSAIIVAGKKRGIVIREEANGVDDPIHDMTTSGGLNKFRPERLAFNLQHTKQFFHPDAVALGWNDVARKYSKQSPLDVELTWGEMDIGDIAQAVSNVQNCKRLVLF